MVWTQKIVLSLSIVAVDLTCGVVNVGFAGPILTRDLDENPGLCGLATLEVESQVSCMRTSRQSDLVKSEIMSFV